MERRELLTVLTVKNTNDLGPDSLRAAITTANTDHTVGGDTIDFAIGGSGTHTIALQSPLPTILGKIQINGPTSVAGAIDGSGPPQIIIDGTNAGAGANGLTLLGPGGSTVSGLAIVNFGSGTNGGGRGILVNDGGGDTFQQDYLGIDPNGSTAKPNVVGIEIKSPNNIVGAVGPILTGQVPNLISGNKSDGILIDGAGANHSQVVANLIGTDFSGEFSVPNLHGITIASASNNTIGGTATGSRNLISGNVVGPAFTSGIGINILGTSSGNVITGNLIGTDITGKKTLNNIYGIYLGTLGGSTSDAVANTTIGGTTTGSGNTISGNGIGIAGNVSTSLIEGNRIGTDLTGTSPIGNGYGIYLGANGTTIGGTTAGAGNIIADSGLIGSGGTGLDLTGDSDLVEGNVVNSNAVGISLHVTNSTVGGTTAGSGNVVSGNTGSGIVLDSNGANKIQGNVIGGGSGNGGNGISVVLATPSGSGTSTSPLPLNDTIGGLVAGGSNTITNNKGAGVAVTNNLGAYTGLSIRGNTVSGNGDLGISLGTTTRVPTLGTLAITSAVSTASSSTIQGVLGGVPKQTYLVDLYTNSVADASGFGEGQNFLGTLPVTIGLGGIASFSQTFNTPLGSNPVITATSTDNSNSTSEYSAAFPNTIGSADLGITQSVSSSTVANGGIVTFTAKVTNNSTTTTARNVVYTDALPTSLINGEVTSSVGTIALDSSSNVATAQLGDLAPGASATVTISANPSVNGSVSNTAGVLGTTGDPTYANNLTTQTFNVGPVIAPMADLAITVNPSTTSPSVGSNLTYTLTVTNNGTANATNVTVNDFLPTGATLVRVTPSQGAAATTRGTLVTDNLGAIASGASATITVVVTATSAGSIVNSANVSGTQIDPVSGNNSATSTLTVASSGTAVLTLTQVLNPSAITPGKNETITLTVRNTGTAAASGVVLVDSIPTGVTLLTAAPSQGSQATFSNNVVTSNLGTIAAGASATLTLTIVATAQATGQVNSAAVVATGTSANTAVFSQVVLNFANGPTVNSVSGSRSNAQLVVNFTQPLTSASATNRANYKLYTLGKTARAVTASDLPIAFTSAVYSPSTNIVTLTPSRSIDPTQYYTLVIVGNTSGGVTDTSGRKLVGVPGGAAGTNYSTTFLAGSLPQV